MKCSEMIKILENLKETNGDFDILTLMDDNLNRQAYDEMVDRGTHHYYQLGYLPVSIHNPSASIHFGVTSGKAFWHV